MDTWVCKKRVVESCFRALAKFFCDKIRMLYNYVCVWVYGYAKKDSGCFAHQSFGEIGAADKGIYGMRNVWNAARKGKRKALCVILFKQKKKTFCKSLKIVSANKPK